MSNRTNEDLLARRALAEKAAPGPWEVLHSNSEIVMPKNCGPELCAVASCFGSRADATHIAANSPDVVMADIDEILRLRAANTWLEQEAEWLANVLKQSCHRDMDDYYCSTCPATLSGISCPSPREECRHTLAKEWREAARKAVEENQ